MTIQSIIDKIKIFNEVTKESGLLRDIEGYSLSFQQPQNQSNMALIKDILDKVINSLEKIYTNDYPDIFRSIFPTKESSAFTEIDFYQKFLNIKNDNESNVGQLFAKLSKELIQLKNSIDSNKTFLDKLGKTLQPFFKQNEYILENEKKAIVSIDFKYEKTISSLKNFSKTINSWDRTLLIYNQLLSSQSPDEIKLVDIENGSIDIIVNIDFSVANNLLELFAVGLETFATYLTWKSYHLELAKSYNGNQKLLKLDEEYEKELIENVGTTVFEKLLHQHEREKQKDANLNSESIDTKLKEVSNLIKEHIVKGNDIRILSASQIDKSIESYIETTKKMDALSKKTKKELKKMNKEELIKMIGEFIPEEKDEKSKKKKN